MTRQPNPACDRILRLLVVAEIFLYFGLGGGPLVNVTIYFGGELASLAFYDRVLGLAPAARPRREHSVFAGCMAGKLKSNWLSALEIGLNAP